MAEYRLSDLNQTVPNYSTKLNALDEILRSWTQPRSDQETGLALLDAPSAAANAQSYKDMIARRAASAYRNAGPQNLFDYPDRNTTLPEDLMSILNSPSMWGERI